jgi:hypothetical protein
VKNEVKIGDIKMYTIEQTVLGSELLYTVFIKIQALYIVLYRERPAFLGLCRGKSQSCTYEELRKAVKVIIGVVIGGVILAGLYALFNTTIIPTLTEKITDMFSYSGS